MRLWVLLGVVLSFSLPAFGSDSSCPKKVSAPSVVFQLEDRAGLWREQNGDAVFLAVLRAIEEDPKVIEAEAAYREQSTVLSHWALHLHSHRPGGTVGPSTTFSFRRVRSYLGGDIACTGEGAITVLLPNGSAQPRVTVSRYLLVNSLTVETVEREIRAIREMARVGKGTVTTAEYDPPLDVESAKAYVERILPDGRVTNYRNVTGVRAGVGWLNSGAFDRALADQPDGIPARLSELRNMGAIQHMIVRHARTSRSSRTSVLIVAYLEAEGVGKRLTIHYSPE